MKKFGKIRTNVDVGSRIEPHCEVEVMAMSHQDDNSSFSLLCSVAENLQTSTQDTSKIKLVLGIFICYNE